MNVDTRRQRPREEYSTQTDLRTFGFTPASQLRIGNLDREGSAQNQEADR